MTSSGPQREDFEEALSAAFRLARDYVKAIDDRPACATGFSFDPAGLPEQGVGVGAALQAFETEILPMMSGTAGPRYLAFVTGGVTPAALAGDWLTATVDQVPQLTGDGGSTRIELEAIAMLRDLLGIDASFHGSFVTGGTMSNFTGLAVGRQHLLRRQGYDLAERGLWDAPRIRILSASAHSSVLKALSMLGMGYGALQTVDPEPGKESINIENLEKALQERPEEPTIVVANAGTVNTTAFDDLEAVGRLKDKYGFWMHVDGAFGAFAAASPHFSHFVRGINAADSIAADGHKWLNVPYDSGVLFCRHLEDQIDVFKNHAVYLGAPDARPDNYLHLGPENSRRFRALPAWLTLKAYGREGYRKIVEGCADATAHIGELLRADSRFDLLGPVPLNVAIFRPKGMIELADIRAYLQRVHESGGAFLSPSVLHGEPIIRICVTSWRTRPSDVDIVYRALVDAL